MALVVATLCVGGCWQAVHEFELTKPSTVAELPPAPAEAVGRTHTPYRGKPAYLAASRPLYPTTSQPQPPQQECARRSEKCDDRLRATLASIDGQILALSTPPTPVQLQALKLELIELHPLLAPYPDITAERDELAMLVDRLPTQNDVEQAATRRRMKELSDLIRVQLAAAQ